MNKLSVYLIHDNKWILLTGEISIERKWETTNFGWAFIVHNGERKLVCLG